MAKPRQLSQSQAALLSELQQFAGFPAHGRIPRWKSDTAHQHTLEALRRRGLLSHQEGQYRLTGQHNGHCDLCGKPKPRLHAITYWELTRRSIDVPESHATPWPCALCGGHIHSHGGPSAGELCHSCGFQLKQQWQSRATQSNGAG